MLLPGNHLSRLLLDQFYPSPPLVRHTDYNAKEVLTKIFYNWPDVDQLKIQYFTLPFVKLR